VSFVRSSKATTKVVVPVLLAGLLATGIVFIEASPANAAACSTTGATTAYAGGAGTSGNPYLLATAEQLALLSATSADSSKHFKQTANISLADGCTWTPIGSSASFTGTYDGGGFTVSGMKTTNHDGARTGLIALLDTGGTVKNVGAVDVDFVGKYHVGGLVGESYGTIQNSYVTGQIVGKVQTGGLVGTYRGGNISNSYAKTSVSYNSVNPNPNNSVEPYRAGGLVGATVGSPGTISYSWSSGIVTTPAVGVTYHIGGVFGGVSSGSTPTFDKVRWDTETSTQSTNAAGSGHAGYSTAQMTSLATFTTDDYEIVSGWEAFNFSTPTNFWGICSGVNDGYPFLLWEYSTNPCVSPPATSSSGASPTTSTTTTTLATTGAEVEWLALGSLIAVVAGAGFFALGRRKRT
jgi:hypothetical protein